VEHTESKGTRDLSNILSIPGGETLATKGMFNIMNLMNKGPCDKLEGTAKRLCLKASALGLSYDGENGALSLGNSGLFLGKQGDGGTGIGFRFPFGK
jgi:hypothetical protein